MFASGEVVVDEDSIGSGVPVVTAAAELTHLPRRPGWDCRCCGKPWPCDPAREELVAETGGGTALAIAGWAYLEEFVRDRAPGPTDELFDRFIRWTHRI
jgi:hypothetical protein